MNLRIKKAYFLYWMVPFIILIGATNHYLTYIAIFGAGIIGVTLGQQSLRKPNMQNCMGIMLLLVFQNLSIGLGAHIAGNSNSSLSLLTQIPFLIIAIQWLFLLISKKKLITEEKKHRFFFLILIIFIFMSLLNGIGSIQSILVNVRNMTVFFMAYEIGLYSIKTADELSQFEQFMFKLGIIVLICGVILLVGGYDLYKLIGIREVYIAKGSPLQSEALDDRFTTSLISREYYRMGSLFYEPVNMGYFFSALALTACFTNWNRNKKKKIMISLLMIVGLILTFGKGGYLITLMVSLYIIGDRLFGFFGRIIGKKALRDIGIIIIVCVTAAFCIYYYLHIGAAVSPHFWGIIQTWQSVLRRPIGYGLGTGGNAALIYGTEYSWYASGGETQLMSFMFQIGAQGIFFFILCVLKTSLIPKAKQKKSDAIFGIIPIALIVLSLLQDNTFTPQCIVLFMILQGAMHSIYEKRIVFNKELIEEENL